MIKVRHRWGRLFFMNRTLILTVLICLLFCTPSFSNELDSEKFSQMLLEYDEALEPISVAMSAAASGNYANSGKKGKVSNSHWLTADKINSKIEVFIQAIEGAKGIATALAVIVNLYESDEISATVALTALRILKLRAFYLRVFVTNGEAEIEIMINIINEHEGEFQKKARSRF